MEKLLNKKLWQKLLIVFLVVILFNAIVVKPVQAVSADILLKPITGLFVGLADALEGAMQKIILGVNESLIEVKYEDPGFWANVLVIGAFIVGTAIAIIAAIPSGRFFSSGMGSFCSYCYCNSSNFMYSIYNVWIYFNNISG